MQWLVDDWSSIRTWLVTVGSSVLAVVAVLGVTYRYLGERLVGHFFERRLEEFKHERARDLERFKHHQNQEIEQLRGAVEHLSDRGKHSNEREYIVTSSLWEKAVDLYNATNMCIMSYIEYPPLNKMMEEELEEFLNTTEISEQQKRLVTEAKDKERSYSHIMGRRQINDALTQFHALNAMLQKQGIFVPRELYMQFELFLKLCIKAIVQRKTEYGEEFRTGLKHDIEFLRDGKGTLEALKIAVRERLLRA